MNHIVDTCPLTKFEGGLNLLHEADDDAVNMAGIYSDCSTREINNNRSGAGRVVLIGWLQKQSEYSGFRARSRAFTSVESLPYNVRYEVNAIDTREVSALEI